MATHPTIHIYKQINIGKYKSTRHFELVKTRNGNSKLTDLLNISKDRKCAKSAPDFWAQVRLNGKWQTPRLTGLFKTCKKNWYKGDKDRRKHLILFRFSEDANTMTVYFFENYYTADIRAVIQSIKA